MTSRFPKHPRPFSLFVRLSAPLPRKCTFPCSFFSLAPVMPGLPFSLPLARAFFLSFSSATPSYAPFPVSSPPTLPPLLSPPRAFFLSFSPAAARAVFSAPFAFPARSPFPPAPLSRAGYTPFFVFPRRTRRDRTFFQKPLDSQARSWYNFDTKSQ